MKDETKIRIASIALVFFIMVYIVFLIQVYPSKEDFKSEKIQWNPRPTSTQETETQICYFFESRTYTKADNTPVPFKLCKDKKNAE